MAASAATHYVRHATNDYLYDALVGLSVAILLIIPAVKKRLLETSSLQALQPQSVTSQVKAA